MDRDKIDLEIAKALVASEPSIVGNHSEFAHLWLSRVAAFRSALEEAGLVVVPNTLEVQQSDSSWLSIRHAKPMFCLHGETLPEARAKADRAMESYRAMISAALGEKGSDDA